MTNLARGKNKDDYPAAAKKHLTDATTLLLAGRFDGAAYLAGYAYECSLRTVIMLGHMQKLASEEAAEKKRALVPLRRALSAGSRALDFRAVGAKTAEDSGGRKHDLDVLAKATTGYKDVLTDGTAVYIPTADVRKLPFGDLEKFTDIRYRAEEMVPCEDAKKWVEEAGAVYDASVGLMIRDGLIK